MSETTENESWGIESEKEDVEWDGEPSDRRGFCGRCKEEYEPYLVLVKENFVAISETVEINEKFNWVCRECRKAEAPSGEYALIDDPTVQDGGEECADV